MTVFGRRYVLATLGYDLATPTNDLATPLNDLATFSVARSFLCVANPLIWCVRSFLST